MTRSEIRKLQQKKIMHNEMRFWAVVIMFVVMMCLLASCTTSNKIAVRYNKYGPVHYEKYQEFNGKYYVHGREVKLIPGTCIYAKK